MVITDKVTYFLFLIEFVVKIRPEIKLKLI